jgi:hypothetical protein
MLEHGPGLALCSGRNRADPCSLLIFGQGLVADADGAAAEAIALMLDRPLGAERVDQGRRDVQNLCCAFHGKHGRPEATESAYALTSVMLVYDFNNVNNNRSNLIDFH